MPDMICKRNLNRFSDRVRLGWQTIWLLRLEELLHDLSPRNEEKQYGHRIHPFSFESSPLLTKVEHLFRQTNS